jgi:hypothetical protein
LYFRELWVLATQFVGHPDELRQWFGLENFTRIEALGG